MHNGRFVMTLPYKHNPLFKIDIEDVFEKIIESGLRYGANILNFILTKNHIFPRYEQEQYRNQHLWRQRPGNAKRKGS